MEIHFRGYEAEIHRHCSGTLLYAGFDSDPHSEATCDAKAPEGESEARDLRDNGRVHHENVGRCHLEPDLKGFETFNSAATKRSDGSKAQPAGALMHAGDVTVPAKLPSFLAWCLLGLAGSCGLRDMDVEQPLVRSESFLSPCIKVPRKNKSLNVSCQSCPAEFVPSM